MIIKFASCGLSYRGMMAKHVASFNHSHPYRALIQIFSFGIRVYSFVHSFMILFVFIGVFFRYCYLHYLFFSSISFSNYVGGVVLGICYCRLITSQFRQRNPGGRNLSWWFSQKEVKNSRPPKSAPWSDPAGGQSLTANIYSYPPRY